MGAAESAADAEEPKNKVRKTSDTVEPVTWHGTAPVVWDEILNIAGANHAFPKLVVELVATDDVLAYLCLTKNIPYLGVCFNDFHKGLLRTRPAQKVFQNMSEEDSVFQPRKTG